MLHVLYLNNGSNGKHGRLTGAPYTCMALVWTTLGSRTPSLSIPRVALGVGHRLVLRGERELTYNMHSGEGGGEARTLSCAVYMHGHSVHRPAAVHKTRGLAGGARRRSMWHVPCGCARGRAGSPWYLVVRDRTHGSVSGLDVIQTHPTLPRRG